MDFPDNVGHLQEYMARTVSLTCLKLHCRTDSISIKKLLRSLYRNRTIHTFELQRFGGPLEDFEATCGATIRDFFRRNKSLRIISLDGIPISDAMARYISQGLQRSGVCELTISQCTVLTDKGFGEILDAIFEPCHLKTPPV